jgi:hypothetical protein
MAGYLIYGVLLKEIGHHYNVSPMIGAGLAGFGNQLLTTLIVTCKPQRLKSDENPFLILYCNRRS